MCELPNCLPLKDRHSPTCDRGIASHASIAVENCMLFCVILTRYQSSGAIHKLTWHNHTPAIVEALFLGKVFLTGAKARIVMRKESANESKETPLGLDLALPVVARYW